MGSDVVLTDFHVLRKKNGIKGKVTLAVFTGKGDGPIFSPEMENSVVFKEGILSICGDVEMPAKTPLASPQLFR